MKPTSRLSVFLLAPVAALLSWQPAAASDLPLETLQLPPGFRVRLFSDAVPNARSLARGAHGTIFVGTRSRGSVYALEDRDGDGVADAVNTLAEGLTMPNGVAFRGGALYVAAVDRILRFDDIEAHLDDPPAPVVVFDGYPSIRHHGWKFIAFGPDGKLYVPVGAPCNLCESDREIFASITRLALDGSPPEIVARGVRNTVGFDWDPATGKLWFSDNGRDWMGDDLPPDELNVLQTVGDHFGYPYCHGDGLADPYFGKDVDCTRYRSPARSLDAHVAALGIHFYRGRMFPESYRGQILIAEHGSWNRTEPVGYRLMLVRLEGEQAVSYEAFASGWLQEDGAWGRPVALLELPDGSLLVSDDRAGVIYRITYGDDTP